MQTELEQENQQLKKQITNLKTELALWKLHAILGGADYEKAMTESNQQEALITLIMQLDYSQEIASEDIEILNDCVRSLQETGYFGDGGLKNG